MQIIKFKSARECYGIVAVLTKALYLAVFILSVFSSIQKKEIKKEVPHVTKQDSIKDSKQRPKK